jgi:hypothetical protein
VLFFFLEKIKKKKLLLVATNSGEGWRLDGKCVIKVRQI